ncbi:MAG TPA: hypothetical protein VGF86_04935 [Candidatus Tumulicola sp.]
MTRPRIAPLAFVAATLLPVAAGAQPRCTLETLNVRGTAVTVGYCLAGAPHADGSDELIVPVSVSYGSAGGSVSVRRELHFAAGEVTSRILDSLHLDRIGMRGVLHLTLAYTGGLVRVEGALLTPGGITIK